MPQEAGTPAASPSPSAPAPLRPPLPQRIRAYRLLLSLAAAIIILDQLTKAWIVARVDFNPYHVHGAGADLTVIGNFFYIIHVGNTGAAWSVFAGQSITLALLAAATLVAIYWWRRALGLRERTTQVCFGLLCGGIVGNLVDRLIHGHVIDFIDLHFGRYVYPTFNVADSGICVGVILFIVLSLRAPR